MALAERIDVLLADYASYHTKRGNKLCHFIGIPLIIYGILGLLRLVPVYHSITAAEVLIAAAFIYYLTLHVPLAVVMLAASMVLDWFASMAVQPWSGLGAFVIGWVFQTIGHAVYEKNRPAFFRNLVHLLVGPLFLLNEAFQLVHHKDTKTQRITN